MRSWSRYLWIGISVAFIVACAISITMAVIPVVIEWSRKSDLSGYTTPLEEEVVEDVCEKFLFSDDPRCEPDGITYAPDFFPEIRRYLHDGKGRLTHKDVQEKLGKYEYRCEDPIYYPSLNKTYYWCSYDLNGDRVFPIDVEYEINNGQDIISRVVADIGDN